MRHASFLHQFSSHLVCFSISRLEALRLQGFVGYDGVLHVIADEDTMESTLGSLDLPRAHILSDAASYWLTRQR